MSRITVIVAPVDVTKRSIDGLSDAAKWANDLGSELHLTTAAKSYPGDELVPAPRWSPGRAARRETLPRDQSLPFDLFR